MIGVSGKILFFWGEGLSRNNVNIEAKLRPIFFHFLEETILEVLVSPQTVVQIKNREITFIINQNDLFQGGRSPRLPLIRSRIFSSLALTSHQKLGKTLEVR